MPTIPTGPFASETPLSRCCLAMSVLLSGSGVLAGVGVVDVDLFAADVLGDRPLLDLDVLVEADALLGDGPLLDDGLLGVQRDLVLFLGEVAAGHGGVAVRIGDRLALQADLFAPDGHGLLDLVGDDVLAQPDASGLAFGRADAQLLLRAGHGLVGLGAGDVLADRGAGRAGDVAGGARGAVVDPVVTVELALLGLAELAVGVDRRGVLNQGLLVGDAQ